MGPLMDTTGALDDVHPAYFTDPPEKPPPHFAYPMWVMPVRTALKLDILMPHQMLMQARAIEEVAPHTKAIFVSHQWLGLRHPDARTKQFSTLQGALLGLMSGLVVKMCPFTAAIFTQPESYLTPEEGKKLIDCHLWYDFFSIPQILQGDEKEAQNRAIDSIPAYVGAATHFFVLAPLEVHEDRGTVVSLETWGRRGWCRAEMGAHYLSQKEKPAVICITKEDRVVETYPFAFLHNQPRHGEFTVDADRQKIARLMDEVCKNRIEMLKSKGKLFETRFLTAMLPWIGGCTNRISNVDEWLLSYGFASSTEACKELGWAPIHFAALEGNLDVLSQLLALGESADRKTKEDLPCPPLGLIDIGMQIPGMTPLMCSAFYIPEGEASVEVAELLLQRDADVNATCGGGETVLHLAAAGAAADGRILSLLVERGARLETPNGANETPLLKACFLCPAGSKFPNLSSIQELVRLGASLTGASSVRPLHPTPLRVACGTSREEDIMFLLEHGADPDGVGDYLDPPTDFEMSALPVHVRESALKDQVEHLYGATPLHWAAYFGNPHGVRLLTEHGADPMAKNFRGRTAKDVMQFENHSKAVTGALDDSMEVGKELSRMRSNGSSVEVGYRLSQTRSLQAFSSAGSSSSSPEGRSSIRSRRLQAVTELRDDPDGVRPPTVVLA